MKNWRTTLFGTLSAISTALSAVFPDLSELFIAIAAVCMAITGILAKDSAVTGTGL
jgi:hypothetical protein